MELCRVDPMQVDQNEFSRLNHLEDTSPIAGLTLCRLNLAFIIDGKLVLSQPSVSVNAVSNSVLRKIAALAVSPKIPNPLLARQRKKLL